MTDKHDWVLPAHCINSIQQGSIERLVEACKGAHMVDVQVRTGGDWVRFEADWIKSLRPKEAV